MAVDPQLKNIYLINDGASPAVVMKYRLTQGVQQETAPQVLLGPTSPYLALLLEYSLSKKHKKTHNPNPNFDTTGT